MNDFKNKPGYGSFFRNKFKSENEKAPDYTGDVCTPDGKDWRISGWLKQDKNGKTYMSLGIEEPRQKDGAKEVYRDAPKPQSRRADLDDEIPFAPEFR